MKRMFSLADIIMMLDFCAVQTEHSFSNSSLLSEHYLHNEYNIALLLALVASNFSILRSVIHTNTAAFISTGSQESIPVR